jgi:hypothetical protein
LSSPSEVGFVFEAGENKASKADCRLARRCSPNEAESEGIKVQLSTVSDNEMRRRISRHFYFLLATRKEERGAGGRTVENKASAPPRDFIRRPTSYIVVTRSGDPG